MLTIRPNVTGNFNRVQSFGERRRGTEISPKEKEQLEHDEMVKSVEKQKETLDSIANDEEIKAPKPLKKVLVVGSVGATAILGGMATGWGAKKSISAFRELGKTAPMQKAKAGTKSFFSAVSNSFKSMKTFISTKFTEMGKSKKAVKFKQTGFGKKLVAFKNSKFMQSISNVFKKAGSGIKNFFKSMYNKIKGIKSEKIENITTNTVAVSGGVGSGYTAFKQEQKSERNYNDNDYDNDDED